MTRRDTIAFPRCSEAEVNVNEKSDFFPSHGRSRTLSQFSITFSRTSKISFDLRKACPTSTVNAVTGSCNAQSSPSASASASLRSLAGPHSSREQTSLRGLQRKKCPMPGMTVDTALSAHSSLETSPSSPSSSLSTKSSKSSIRSISRTSSTSCVSDIPSTAPSSAVPSKPPSLKAKTQCTQLHPVLAACERRSKMSSRTVCATCMKVGYDYPKCAKCGEMWCSRVCRLRDGGKRHICSKNV